MREVWPGLLESAPANRGRWSEGRYRYRREADGLEQWEFPALSHTDMDISTTPPHPGIDAKEESPPPQPATPPPPAWCDPPPPGCDEEPKQEIGDELLSFYNDIAELEKHPVPNTVASSPEPPPAPDAPRERERERPERVEKERVREKEKPKETKRKTKVKISSSMGMKHKTVSSLVAKWQQVADEIHSD